MFFHSVNFIRIVSDSPLLLKHSSPSFSHSLAFPLFLQRSWSPFAYPNILSFLLNPRITRPLMIPASSFSYILISLVSLTFYLLCHPFPITMFKLFPSNSPNSRSLILLLSIEQSLPLILVFPPPISRGWHAPAAVHSHVPARLGHLPGQPVVSAATRYVPGHLQVPWRAVPELRQVRILLFFHVV